MLYLKSHPRHATAIVAVIVIGVALWLALSPKPQDEVWSRVQASGALRVGIDASYPPFETLDENGQIVGFDADLANEIGKRLGLRVEFINIAYDGLLDALLTDRADVLISALADLPQVAGKAAFTLPYYNAGDTLIVVADSGIQSMEDMSGRTLAVEFGSGGDVEARAWERRLSQLTVKRFPDPNAAVAAVISGEADGALVDGIAARLAVGQNPRLALAGNVNDVLFAIAVPSKGIELRKQLNQTIKEMSSDGTNFQLIVRWFGPQRDAGP